MALIVLASAHGSPGVLTTTLGLGLAWPRACMLVDADTTAAAGWFAGYFRGAMPQVPGLVGLATHPTPEQIDRDLLGASLAIEGTEARVLPGIHHRHQVRAVAPLWAPLARSLRKLDDTGQDVLVDAGRLGSIEDPRPLIEAADLVLLVVRAHLPALVGAREWAAELGSLARPDPAHPRVGLMVIGPGKPYRTSVVESTLKLPTIATLPLDAGAATVLFEGSAPGQDWDRSGLVRGLLSAAPALRKAATHNRAAMEALT